MALTAQGDIAVGGPVGGGGQPTSKDASAAPKLGVSTPGKMRDRLTARSTPLHRSPPKAWMLRAPVDFLMLALPAVAAPSHVRAVVCMALGCLALLYSGGRYRARLHVSVLDELPSVLGYALVAAAVVSSVTALRHPSVAVADFIRWAALSILLLVLGRCVTNVIINSARKHRLIQHPTLLIGFGPLGQELARLLSRYPQYGLQVAGVVDDRQAVRGHTGGNQPHPPGEYCDGFGRDVCAGAIDELDSVVRATGADVILVADPARPDGALLDVLRSGAAAACDLLVVPRLHEFHTQAGIVDHIGAIPIMRIRTPALRGPSYVAKRCFDLTLASFALVVLSPVLVAVAAAVRIAGGRTTRGVLFRQQRLTRDGRVFDVVKFRSMRPANEHESAELWTIGQDARVGRVGRFLRRTSLDELPQLWNIVRGDMTFVGPRPERPFFAEQFSAEHPRYAARHRVVCGLTGLAQVSGLRGDTSISDRARYDNFYIENWSLWLDTKVLLRTVGEVFGGRGR